MTNRSVPLAFQAWVRRRPGGLPGLIATVCLMGAAVLALSQTVGRHSRPRRGPQPLDEVLHKSTGEAERRFAEARWRIDVSKKLEAILSRVSEGTRADAPATD